MYSFLSQAFIEYCFDSKGKKVTCRSPLSTSCYHHPQQPPQRSQGIRIFIIDALDSFQPLRLDFHSKCLCQRSSQPSPLYPSAHPSRLNQSTTSPLHPQNSSYISSLSSRPPHSTLSLKPHTTSKPSCARTQQQYATTQF